MNEQRVERLVIFLSIVIAIFFSVDAYNNYDKWKAFEVRAANASKEYNEKIKNCESIKDLTLNEECIGEANRWNNESEFWFKGYEYKVSMKQSLVRWLALQLTLVGLFFGIRWVWTGNIKSKSD